MTGFHYPSTRLVETRAIRMIPKSSDLVYGMIFRYPTRGKVFRSDGQRSRSQGHKVQKHSRRSSDPREFAPVSSAHRLVCDVKYVRQLK